MRIVHIVDYFTPLLGYQEVLLAKYHAKKHDVFILTSDKYYPFPNYAESYQKLLGKRACEQGEETTKEEYKIIRLKSFFEVASSTFILYQKLYKTLQKIKPDLIICHGLIKPNHFWALRYKKKNQNCKLVIDHHEAIYNTDLTNSFVKRFYVKLWKFFVRPLVLKYADKIIATGPNEKEFAIEHLLGKKYADKIEIVPLGADEEKFYIDSKLRKQKREEYGFKNTDIVIINAGKINKSKKNLDLLKAFVKLSKKHKNVYLFLIGSGDKKYFNEIKKIIAEHKLEKKVFLKELVPNDELCAYFNMADIGCWPGSRSNIFWEAMACGLPLILEDMDYSYELIENQNGFVVKNMNEIATNLEKIIIDENLRKKMSQNSEKLFKNNFSCTKLSEQFIVN